MAVSYLKRSVPEILCPGMANFTFQALLQASLAPHDYKDIFQNTKGIIFLGTPHHGTTVFNYNAASLVTRLAIGMHSNPDILRPLEKDSSILVRQQERFAKLWDRWHVVNFYETRALPLWKAGLRVKVRFLYKHRF